MCEFTTTFSSLSIGVHLLVRLPCWLIVILGFKDFSYLRPLNANQRLQLVLNGRNNDFCSNPERNIGYDRLIGMGLSLR